MNRRFVYYTAVRFIMNILRTGGRPSSDGVINEPGRACFQRLSLPPKDLRRPQGSNPLKVINDCQSLIKRCFDSSCGCMAGKRIKARQEASWSIQSAAVPSGAAQACLSRTALGTAGVSSNYRVVFGLVGRRFSRRRTCSVVWSEATKALRRIRLACAPVSYRTSTQAARRPLR